MRWYILFFIAFFSSCGTNSVEINQLNWLQGQWHRSYNGVKQFENWVLTNDSLHAFTGFSTHNESTILQEKIICKENNQLVLIDRDANNNLGNKYTLVHSSLDSLVFQNVTTTWPNKVIYSYKTDTLQIQVLGVHQGMKKNMAFDFVK